MKIQESWSAQDLSQIKHFVSDGIFERFTLQIQEQRDMGYRDFIERIRIHSATGRSHIFSNLRCRDGTVRSICN